MRPVSTIAIAILAALSPAAVSAQQPVALQSPDRHNEIRIDTGNGLHFEVIRDGKPVLASSPMGLFTDHGSLGGQPVTIVSTDRSSADENEDGADRNSVRKRAVSARKGGGLSLSLAATGGAVAVIEPQAG